MPAGLKEKQIHPSRRLSVPGGGMADIDVAMVPLVRALWEVGMRTSGCCQDLGDRMTDPAPGIRYALVVPSSALRAGLRVPRWVRDLLQVTVYEVRDDSTVARH